MRKKILAALIFLVPCSALLILNCSGEGGSSASSPGISNPPSGCVGEGGAATSAPAGTAILSWDPVTAPILAGYRVYYGTVPGMYVQTAGEGLNAGNVTGFTVSGLNKGVRYYFAVTAYDAAGLETGYSNEVCKLIS